MISRDRLEVILESISKGEKISNVRNRLEMIFSAIAEKIGEGGGGEPTTQTEVIPFSGGTGTNSREFTFDKPIKFVAIEYIASSGNKMINFSITAKAGGHVSYLAPWLDPQSTSNMTSMSNLLTGYATFSEDLKTMTLTSSGADVACNGGGSGNIFVVY